MATKNPEIHIDEIALFSRPPVNVAEDRISWHEVRPSYMSNADYSSINFSIIGNSSQYVKLSDTELYVRINIEKVQGFIRPIVRVGSGDPVRVLHLYTTITLDEVCSIYC